MKDSRPDRRQKMRGPSGQLFTFLEPASVSSTISVSFKNVSGEILTSVPAMMGGIPYGISARVSVSQGMADASISLVSDIDEKSDIVLNFRNVEAGVLVATKRPESGKLRKAFRRGVVRLVLPVECDVDIDVHCIADRFR